MSDELKKAGAKFEKVLADAVGNMRAFRADFAAKTIDAMPPATRVDFLSRWCATCGDLQCRGDCGDEKYHASGEVE